MTTFADKIVPILDDVEGACFFLLTKYSGIEKKKRDCDKVDFSSRIGDEDSCVRGQKRNDAFSECPRTNIESYVKRLSCFFILGEISYSMNLCCKQCKLSVKLLNVLTPFELLSIPHGYGVRV